MAASLALAVAFIFDRERVQRNYFRIRSPAFDLSEENFVKLFRLDKESALEVTERIRNVIAPSRIPVELRVLVALRFFASGCYQGSVGNDIFIALSQQSVSRCIREVSKAISNHLQLEFIKFPSRHGIQGIKQQFYSKSGLPGIIGAIDCTHVAIVSPPSTESGAFAYMNRKGFNSINVQLIVDSDLQIMGINAKFPGSVHDAFIWKHSVARQHISQIKNGWLIGDSGYPLEPWLMTPFISPAPGSVEECYNNKHSSARSCVERCNGVLKTRFRCLLKDRVLHYSPTVAGHIINACAVLHNICNARRIEVIEDINTNFEEDEGMFEPQPESTSGSNRSKEIRLRIALNASA